MKISVVVCTYNGEKYIYEQLQSILAQTLAPFEVIIQDDCSSDRTKALVEKFIASRELYPRWKLFNNVNNLGWKKNFMSAISKASGDIIFLCDQDDIWHLDKLEKMTEVFTNNSEIELLFSELEAFDDNTNKRVSIYQPKYGKNDVTKVKLKKYFAECGRQGCTFAIKKSIVKYIEKMWQEDWPHDGFLWCICLARGTLYSYNEPLIYYRRHELSNTPSNEKNNLNRCEILARYVSMGNMLIQNGEELGICKQYEEIIRNGNNVYKLRLENLRRKRLVKILFLIRYIKYYPRPRAWIGDVISVFG